MKHSELVTLITKYTGREPKNREFAKVLELTPEAIRSRAFRDVEYSYSDVEKLKNYFGINNGELAQNEALENSEEILVDYYPDVLASCGNGAFELSNVSEKIRIPKICIEQYSPISKYSVINAYGESMQPTIQNKDKLIIEIQEDYDRVKDNNIYIFSYEDRIFCKRLVQNIDNVVVISDNPNKSIYPTSIIERERMNDIHLIGRIVGLMRGLG